MNPTVLLLSRDESMAAHLARHIEKNSCRTLVSDGLSGHEHSLKKERIDTVVLVVNGLEGQCVEMIKSIRRCNKYIKVILVNNSDQVNLSIQCMKAGAFDDFYPPIDMQDFLTAIDRAILKKKQKIGPLDRIMMAISFAEAGSTDTAREYLKHKENESWKK